MKCPKCDTKPVDYAGHYSDELLAGNIDVIVSKKIREINSLNQEVDILLACLKKLGCNNEKKNSN